MQFEEVASPEPAANEVLIKTEAIGVNYVDTMRRSGKHPSAPQPPFIPGSELCGTVHAVGADVSGFKPGERVIGRCVSHGAYAEFVCVESRFTVHCPASIPADEAAGLFVNAQTAYHALVTVGKVQAGDNVSVMYAPPPIAQAVGPRMPGVLLGHTESRRDQIQPVFRIDAGMEPLKRPPIGEPATVDRTAIEQVQPGGVGPLGDCEV